jgi:NADH:ubiquinone oxidoreductase subunit 3 (subunit A)
MPADFDLRWAAVILSGIVGFLAICGMFAASMFISSRRHSAVKLTAYECGIEPAPFRWSQINIRYYIFAILFLIFDVEAVFLFPWAVIFLGNNVAFYAMALFLGVLLFAVAYAWKKGALEWSK